MADSAAARRKAVLIRAPSECTYNRRVVLSPETNRVCRVGRAQSASGERKEHVNQV